MTAPERIWTASTNGKCHVGFDAPSLNYTNEYVRADLAAVQPAQVQPDPRDEVIKGLVEAATDAAEAIDMAYGSDDDESPHRHSAKLRAAIAAAKAVQHG